jgi:uncharacterized protein YndB with AHSA1/START domain
MSWKSLQNQFERSEFLLAFWELKFAKLDILLIKLAAQTQHIKSKKMANKTIIKAEPGKQELFIIREFEAPRELVFRAFTEPDLLVQWLGPRDLKMKIEHMNCESGGSYRYAHSDPSGAEYWFNGVIHEVQSPDRIIQTFEFEGLPERGHVALDTATFEALPGNRTRLTTQTVFKSVSDRDGMIGAGMERGVVDSHERLDEILAKNK